MSTANNPISHHTSHTMANGASSSSTDINGNPTHPIRHHTSHTLENGAGSSNSGAYGDGAATSGHCHNQAPLTETSLTTLVTDFSNFTSDQACSEPDVSEEDEIMESPSPCSSEDSFSTSSNYDSGITTTVTSMSSSLNFAKFSIIDTTLREGEQFATAYFDTAQKLKIAQGLDDLGVEFIEVTSPAASLQSRLDCEAICRLGLKAKVLCHIRCNMDDARIAVQTGVDGINMCIGTSKQLISHSHGKDLDYIAAKAEEVIGYVKSQGLEIRFSGEDSFRSDFTEIIKLYSLVDRLGADRVGIADTVGGATPREVYDKISTLRQSVSCDIETHFHNDTGCAIANALEALEAGATHIDTTVLGIGERNGITPLGGLLAALKLRDPERIRGKYTVEKLKYLEHLVAQVVKVEIPFNATNLC